MRVNRWLCAARIYHSRTQATAACGAGHVCINGGQARASHPVRVGDCISAEAPRGTVVLDVLKLADKRLGPPLARELYQDHSPPPAPPEDRYPARSKGEGRPTKRDRRAIDRMRLDE